MLLYVGAAENHAVLCEWTFSQSEVWLRGIANAWRLIGYMNKYPVVSDGTNGTGRAIANTFGCWMLRVRVYLELVPVYPVATRTRV